MDQSTQQNAAMVEESTAAASSLAEEATKLRDLIADFKLDGPSRPRAANLTSIPVASPARALGNKVVRAFGGKGAAALRSTSGRSSDESGNVGSRSGTDAGIIAFYLGDQQFCIKTTSIREIQG